MSEVFILCITAGKIHQGSNFNEMRWFVKVFGE